jgi:hypothetical protein
MIESAPAPERHHSDSSARFLRRTLRVLSTAFAGLLLLSACGDEVSISISPSSNLIEAGGSATLIVDARRTEVVWPETMPGTVSRVGNRVTYTPPAEAGTYEFTVVAEADPGKSATALVEVFVPPTPEITAFSLPQLAAATIDQEAGTISFSTREWIDDIDALAATFTASGIVQVDGVLQASGTTKNDFRRSLQYTVSTGKFAHRTYTVRLDAPQATGLPVIRIDTQDGQEVVSKEAYLQASITISDPRNPGFDYKGVALRDQVRGRGNTTWTYPKKPYRIRFAQKRSVFGLAEARNWVLLANYLDPTLMMTSIAMETGQRLGLPFTNHYVHTELFVNGEYRGSYLLTEHVQVGEGRVDIDEDHGFFVELDSYFDDEPKFRTEIYDLPVMIKSPEDLDDPSGYDFVKAALHELETALTAPTFPDSGYRELISTSTLIDYLLVNELLTNNELGWPKSTYLHRDVGGKIQMGPIWDFDWGFGYTGLGHEYFTAWDYIAGKHAFFTRFFDDPEFLREYRTRWRESLQRSQEHNFAVWPEARSDGFAKEVEDLISWWRKRIEYLDGAMADED